MRHDLQVRRVELRQPEPPTPAPYVQVFRAPIHFGAAADRLCFSRAQWESPMTGADAALARLLEEHARILIQRLPAGHRGFTTEVQDTIASGLPESGAVGDVARALHVSVRTLQRKLVEAGTTFSAVSDSIRSQLAEEYLADETVSIAEVAFLLGYSEQSSFNRTFRRWTGESPGRWRQHRS